MSKNRFEQWVNIPIKLLKNVDPTIKRLYQDPTTELAWLAWKEQQKVIDEYVMVAESLDDYMYLNTLPHGGNYDQPERIVCAANLYDDVVLCGIRHGSEDMYSLWNLVEDFDSCFFGDWEECKQGFITSKGRFVSRKEAWKIALEQRQIVRLVGNQTVDSAYKDTELYSENLY